MDALVAAAASTGEAMLGRASIPSWSTNAAAAHLERQQLAPVTPLRCRLRSING